MDLPFPDGLHGGRATAKQPWAGNRSCGPLTWLLTGGLGPVGRGHGRQRREVGWGEAVASMSLLHRVLPVLTNSSDAHSHAGKHHPHLPSFTGDQMSERSSDSLAHPAINGKVRPLTRSCLCYNFGKWTRWDRHRSLLASCSRGQSL